MCINRIGQRQRTLTTVGLSEARTKENKMSVYDASGDHSSNKGWADTRGTTNTNQTRMFPMRSFKTRIRTTVSGAVIAASLFAVMANAQVAVSAFKPIPVGSGTLMVGSGGSISYCSGPIQTALSGTLFNLNLVGKCKKYWLASSPAFKLDGGRWYDWLCTIRFSERRDYSVRSVRHYWQCLRPA